MAGAGDYAPGAGQGGGPRGSLPCLDVLGSPAVRTAFRAVLIAVQALWQGGRYAVGRTLCFVLAWRVPAGERRARVERLRALCFTDFFRNLGATFIKIGQILSSRPDLLPPYIIDELQLLQDHVPSFDYVHVQRTFQEDFGKPPEEVFRKIEERPLAAASIAQVHEAWLQSGEHVAVKVRRPNIAEAMKGDLSVIRLLARMTHWMPYLGTLRMGSQAETFARAIHAQLDLSQEARNNRRFRENFKDFSFARFPKLIDEYCSGRVITMEFCKGKKLQEVVENPPLERKELASRLFAFYIEMVFGNQFIHADLHPGNVFIDERGNFILLDTGLVCDMPREYVKRFMQLALSVSTLDGPTLVRAYLEGRKGEPAAPDVMARAEKDAKVISDRLAGKKLKDIEFGKVFLDIFALLRKYRIWLEPELTMMMVSDITMEGMAKTLYPDFDMIGCMQAEVPKYLPRLGGVDVPEGVKRFYAERAKAAQAQSARASTFG